jgi:hypothetical protein
MAVRIEVNGNWPRVGQDLMTIVGPDAGNLGQTGSGGDLLYNKSPFLSRFPNDRLDFLVNSIGDVTVWITGLITSDTYEFEGVSSDPRLGGSTVPLLVPIRDNVGVTIVGTNSLGSDRMSVAPGGVIEIYYDVMDNWNQGYCLFDSSGRPIRTRTDTVLFHELAHAYQWATGTYDAAQAERLANTDENTYRTLQTPPLGTIDVTRHDGGRVGEPPCGSNVPTLPVQELRCPRCFIVSAAAGSPEAPAVAAFQRLRDEWLRRSLLADHFFTVTMAEYYRFSPRVALDMQERPALRAAVAALAVNPLLAFLELFEGWVRGGWCDSPAFERRAAGALRRSAADLARFGWSPEEAAGASAALVDSGRGPARTPSGRPSPVATFEYLARSARCCGRAPSAYLRWALIEPLRVYLPLVERARHGSETVLAATLAAAIEDWLVRFPVGRVLGNWSEDMLARDLSLLAELAFTIPAVRARLARRWLAGGAPASAGSALAAAGYLDVEAGNGDR